MPPPPSPARPGARRFYTDRPAAKRAGSCRKRPRR
eukprot:CAMPEP_0184121970 /NCGR_PEP_ID=MMETSP0974-20121125/23246_1 /TAXON_ID=483370 /ORGANISM="non described non described, Strain CCMP2097" /LENGTH=34 /DNA_ID= /DNA_START= /DNA_END= /DNA_ORIENTATION=